ncbi:hypothetical protein MASR2M18_18130 [Ignavibacteria bacterium]
MLLAKASGTAILSTAAAMNISPTVKRTANESAGFDNMRFINENLSLEYKFIPNLTKYNALQYFFLIFLADIPPRYNAAIEINARINEEQQHNPLTNKKK